MNSSGNGEKSRVIWWLVSILQAVVLALSGWIGTNVVQAKSDIAVLQANYGNIEKSLSKLNEKMDDLLSLRSSNKK